MIELIVPAIIIVIFLIVICINLSKSLHNERDRVEKERQKFTQQVMEYGRALAQTEREHQAELRDTLALIREEHRTIVADWNTRYEEQVTNYKKILGEKKRTEIRTGKILEKVAPLLDDFPADILNDNIIPIFGTVDFLAILENEIIFIEVKSGNAQLNQRQVHIKKLVEDGKVSFRIFRRRGKEGDSNGKTQNAG